MEAQRDTVTMDSTQETPSKVRDWFDAGFLLVFWVLASVAIAGLFLSSFRVYLTGTPIKGIIVQCSKDVVYGINGPGYIDYSVRTDVRLDSVPIEWCDPIESVGKSVTVVYSRAADKGVAVLGEPTFWRLTKSLHGDRTLLIFIDMVLLGTYLTILRLRTLAVLVTESLAEAFKEIRIQHIPKMARFIQISEFVLDVFFLALIFTALGVLVFAMFKGVLFLESSSWIFFSILALASLTFFWSPAPNLIVAWVWKSYRKGALALMRNIVASVLLLNSIVNLANFTMTVDFSKFHTAIDLTIAIAKAILGLD